VPSNQHPWIEVKEAPSRTSHQNKDSGTEKKIAYQAMFACQIGIKPFDVRINLKWGFSAAFLLEEALDRQKLFIESQLSHNPIDTQIERRVFALRCSSSPGSGIRLGLVAKVMAETRKAANEFAQNYFREIESIFPLDYTIRPATSPEEFNRLSGREILEKCNDANSIVQIRRFEQPLRTSKGVFRILGLWQTGMRSDEQIWRALANYPHEILLNVTLCPTILFEGERRALLEMKRAAQATQDISTDEPYLQNYETWIEPFIDRHLSPWNRYFYLQVHLVSPQKINDSLFRSIGSAITRDHEEQSSPGFQVIHPQNDNTAFEWRNYLDCLNIVPTSDNTLIPRLSELASLDEAHAVFRLPYPPEADLPKTKFLED